MAKSSNIYLSTNDFFITQEPFDLVFDDELEMLTTFPSPSTAELPAYYQSEDYISHTDEKRGLLPFLYQTIKKWSLKKKIKLIERENGGKGSLLDIGAGTGDFLKSAKEKGWRVKGIEPNTTAINLAADKGVELKREIDNIISENFDVVTLWHVLEHIPDLKETIQKLGDLVKPGGTLIIAVPNFKSFDAEYYKNFWAAYDVPRHLWHFSKKSIKVLFDEDFKLQKIKPMIFDSFYVSLLSEKYKSGNKFSITGICIGLLSNLKGLHSKQYSSHIYILKRKNTQNKAF